MWIIGTMAHLPFPMLDCDDLHRGPSANSGQWNVICTIAERYLVHIDLILLGSDCPDEPDDGPFDRTPEGGQAQFGPYPVFLGTPTGSELLRQQQWHSQVVLNVSRQLLVHPLELAGPVWNSPAAEPVPWAPLISSTTVLRC